MEQPSSGQHASEPAPQPVGEPIGGEQPVSRTTSSAASTPMPPAQQQRTLNESFSQLDALAERARVALPAAPPGLLDGYMRYYLKSVNRPAGANAQAAFTATFAIPDTIRDALIRQLDVVLGGI